MDATNELNSTLGGRYAVEREIGRGGMAIVYLARDLRHARNVALKVLTPELKAMVGVERFLSEIRVTANLHHPHLLPLFDSGEADGLLFYVMPFVEGESLRARLVRERQLPVDDALRIAAAVASALDYAHRHGIVHRDLKPENILLHEGQPLIADFGVALAVSKSVTKDRLTKSGIAIGTPQYSSPEQAAGDPVIDARTDIYSLGAVLYEMLAGDPPHAAPTVQGVIAKIVTDAPKNVRQLRSTVPVHVADAVECALEKLPADRFATAQQFADALQGRGPVSGVFYLTPSSRAALEGRTWRRRIRDPVLLSLAVIAVGATAAAGWRWTVPPAGPRDTPVRFTLALAPDETVASGDVGTPFAITPDGQQIAYLGLKIGRPHELFLRQINDPYPRPIAATREALHPAFSADGKWLAFFADGKLQKVAVAGGEPVTLARPPTIYGLSWVRPDVIVAGQSNGPLLKVPANGGDPRAITSLDTSSKELSQRWPLVLENGETVLYTSWRSGGNAAARIGVASLKTGASRLLDLEGVFPLGVIDGQLMFADETGQLKIVAFDLRHGRVTGLPMRGEQGQISVAGALKAALSRSGTLIYQQAVGTGVMEMVAVDTAGRVQTLLHGERRPFSDPRISPDGAHIAVTIGTDLGTSDIWLYEVASGARAPLTTGDGISSRPEWTRDGKRIVFESLRKGGVALWWTSADRSSPAEPLLPQGLEAAQGFISPDGKSVIYRTDSESGDGQHVWYRNRTGDTVSKAVVRNPNAKETAPSLSPDGRWIAYASDESGASEVYVRPFPGPGALCLISTNGGTEPAWSRDGRRVFYRNGVQLMAASVAMSPACSVTSRVVLFEGAVHGDDYHRQFDVGPVGTQFIMLREYGHDSGTEIVHNWIADLRSRIPKRAR